MNQAKNLLLISLGILFLGFIIFWVVTLTRKRQWERPTWYEALVGFVTDFLDTLGIGSYAITTTLYRLRKTIDDAKIPGTLTVGHAIPIAAQAFIYITIVEVEFKTLFLLILASILGAWLGAGFVTRMRKSSIQFGMGLALLVAATLMISSMLDILPRGRDALGLDGPLLVVGIVGNFIFGALMTIGVGAYAPIMIMVCLLGMTPKSAFPIMMGSCAFLMPIAGYRFIRSNAYDARAALGLTLAGTPAVFLAAYIVKELPLDAVRGLVVIVVLYTATTMLLASRKNASRN